MIKKYAPLVLICLAFSILTSCEKRSDVIVGNTVKNIERVTNYADSLDIIFREQHDKGHLPGFALSIFTADSIYFTKGYGYSDLTTKKRFDEHTVQSIASISKTFIAIALMKAVEDGDMSLDDDINSILPFKVVNPKFPNSPITLRQLATHTSSINDEGNYDKAYVFSKQLDPTKFPDVWAKYLKVYNVNKLMSMETFLMHVFSKSEWQSKDNFLSVAPGVQYEYSNIGAALLAYCIQIRTGVDYKELTRQLILEPLNMSNSSWDLSEVDPAKHITYYNEIYNIVPSYHVITYPDGGLYTSVSDLTKYLQEMMRGYSGDGKVLTSDSYKIMMKNQIPELDAPTGIVWDMDNDCCIGHGGNDFGVATMMYFDPKTQLGKVLFTNITTEKEEIIDQFYATFNDMFKYDSEIVESLNIVVKDE